MSTSLDELVAVADGVPSKQGSEIPGTPPARSNKRSFSPSARRADCDMGNDTDVDAFLGWFDGNEGRDNRSGRAPCQPSMEEFQEVKEQEGKVKQESTQRDKKEEERTTLAKWCHEKVVTGKQGKSRKHAQGDE